MISAKHAADVLRCLPSAVISLFNLVHLLWSVLSVVEWLKELPVKVHDVLLKSERFSSRFFWASVLTRHRVLCFCIHGLISSSLMDGSISKLGFVNHERFLPNIATRLLFEQHSTGKITSA